MTSVTVAGDDRDRDDDGAAAEEEAALLLLLLLVAPSACCSFAPFAFVVCISTVAMAAVAIG